MGAGRGLGGFGGQGLVVVRTEEDALVACTAISSEVSSEGSAECSRGDGLAG